MKSLDYFKYFKGIGINNTHKRSIIKLIKDLIAEGTKHIQYAAPTKDYVFVISKDSTINDNNRKLAADIYLIK